VKRPSEMVVSHSPQFRPASFATALNFRRKCPSGSPHSFGKIHWLFELFPRALSMSISSRVAVPRGCLTETLALLQSHKIRPVVRDERFAGTPIEVEFRGQLRQLQEEAVAKIVSHDEGILCAPTAFGKTAIAAWLIAKRKVNTLVVVHRQQLLDQWQERLGMFLDLPAKAIGHVGGGKTDRTGCVDVAVIQSLHRKDEVKDFVAQYGQVIVDECHHISAFTFEQVMRQAAESSCKGKSSSCRSATSSLALSRA
jgi:Type III restriction enzyme, res subunit